MIGIESIGSYIPEYRESNYLLLEKFNVDKSFLENKIGVQYKAIKHQDQDTSDMCLKAFQALQSEAKIDISEIDCLVVCTQNPDGEGLPHTSSIVHGKLDAPDDCAAFDINLGCSGYVYSLSIISQFMAGNGMQKGLLFTCDPYSKIIDPSDKNTSMLFGDAATVTLLSANPRYRATSFAFGTKGKESHVLQRVKGQLVMNGRLVFSLSMLCVPEQVNKVLQRVNLKVEDVDLFVFHQGSKYILDMLGKRLGLAPEKIINEIAEYGNTISSSIPLILERRINDDHGNKNIIISGFGVGFSWATCHLGRV